MNCFYIVSSFSCIYYNFSFDPLFFSEEKFRRIFKELFLLRELTKECCEELKATVLEKGNVNITDGNESKFFNTFHFPLRSIEELEEVEQYLQERNNFQSTVCSLYFCFDSSLHCTTLIYSL